MTIEIRSIRDAEVPAFGEALFQTFGTDADADPDFVARFEATVDPAQAWAAFDGGSVVATAATYPLELGVPGGATLPVAGLTMVTVRPTHRRRGLLRALMAKHLEDARARGYAVSGLWASESPIYGRFGYGLAAFLDAVEIEQAHARQVAAGQDLDEVIWLDEATARAALPAVYARATAARPGALRRTDAWWHARRFVETPWARAGASRLRHVAARRDGELVGYLGFRQKSGFTAGVPTGTVAITELIACDPRAEATLWRFALSVDLCPTVTWWNAPVDDSLWWIIDDARRVRRRRTDNVWLRVEDVPRALAARGYTADGRLRLAIEEDVYELEVRDGRARCTATSAAPELRLGRATLGALYLGGTPASALARAELVRGDARAIALADHLFASPVAPWCPEVF